MRNKKKVRLSVSDKALNVITTVFLSIMGLLVLYPLIYVLACSFSSPEAVMAGDVILLPKEVTLEGYKAVFRNNKIVLGFANSAFYTIVGTVINVFMTIICAYPLSRSDMPGQKIIIKLFTFTMIFTGGMIPNYLLLKELGMLNTRWALLIPGAITVYNMIITRTFFINSIPRELLEASQIDGCSDIRYLTSIVIPLSKSIIAVITLYYAVAHWNQYFDAFMYLSDYRKYPLQIFLRDILISSKVGSEMIIEDITNAPVFGLEYVLKYSLIVVSTVPMLIIYPLVQKHFVKGVMIGAIKG